MPRPLLKANIEELEAALDRRRVDLVFLQALVDELSHRSTYRAARSKARAVQALGTAPKSSLPRSSINQSPPASIKDVVPEPTLELTATSPVRAPMPPLRDDPVAVLSAWTALEVL